MSLGPLDLTGGPFLALYGTLLVAAIVAGFVIPRTQREAGSPRPITGADRVAYLSAGAPRVVDAVVTRMLTSGALRMTEGKLFAPAMRAASVPGPEGWILTLPQPIWWADIRRATQPYAARVEHELVAAGALIDAADTTRLRWRQTAPYLLLLALGAAKWIVGTMRDRPVGYLSALLIVTVILAAVRWSKVERATASGAAALQQARHRADRLRRAPTADEADLAVALFGTAVLAGSGWAAYHQMRAGSSGDGGSGDGGSGCGGGDGGGGCGGCGS